MLEKKTLQKIYRNMNKKEIVNEMLNDLLYFRDFDGIVYAKLDIETGEIETNYASKSNLPNYEGSICLCEYETGHLEEVIPPDIPKHIKDADDVIAEWFKNYAIDIFEFISEEEFTSKLKNK